MIYKKYLLKYYFLPHKCCTPSFAKLKAQLVAV